MNDAQPQPPGSQWAGQALRSTLRFLAGPAVLALMTTVFGVQLPHVALYGVAALFGLALVIHTLRDPEWLLALVIIYLPLNKMFVVPMGPGLNGTNALLVLLVLAWIRHGRKVETVPAPAVSLVRTYMILSLLSVVTALVTLGWDFVSDKLIDIKGWLDQFIVFFAFLRLIRDGRMARRLLVYMMIAAVVVLVLGFQEWLDKRTASSIEKSRLLGPQMQPNDFGAFLAYASMFFVAQLLIHLKRWRTWAVMAPCLVIFAKLLVSTFSRGAYLGLGLAGVVAGYVRGKAFLAGTAVLGLGLLIAMPQLVPESLQARMSQTTTQSPAGEKLDASAEARIILWKAALAMTAESPVFGWGFKAFPQFKAKYTEVEVEESDNHNMYLYLSSQMGIPTALLLLLIFWRMGALGVQVYRRSSDAPARTLAMGAAAMAAGAAVVNMFGSRMVDICVTAHLWITLAVLVRLWLELEERRRAEAAG